jgi:hypothetical protein
LVIPFVMVVGRVLGHAAAQVALAERDQPIQALMLDGRTNRSACALQFGARTGVWTTCTPADRINARAAPLHFRSRLQIWVPVPNALIMHDLRRRFAVGAVAVPFHVQCCRDFPACLAAF